MSIKLFKYMNGNGNGIRIPKSWILLIVFIVSVIGAGAWIYTTPPNGLTNQTGIWFGNNSMDGRNVTGDRINVFGEFGTLIGSYVDSYSCDGSFCVYSPWFAPTYTYAKNMSDGTVTKNTDADAVLTSILPNGGKIYFIDSVSIDSRMILTSNNIVLTGDPSATITAGSAMTSMIEVPKRTNLYPPIEINNLNLDGAGLADDIINVSTMGVKIKGTNITNFLINGIYINESLTVNTNEVSIADNRIVGSFAATGRGTGIYFENNVSDNQIFDNKIHGVITAIIDNSSCATVCSGGGDNQFYNNHFYKYPASTQNIQVITYGGYDSFKNNVFDGYSQYGLIAPRGSVFVEDNFFYGVNGAGGIYFNQSANGDLYNTIVQDNFVRPISGSLKNFVEINNVNGAYQKSVTIKENTWNTVTDMRNLTYNSSSASVANGGTIAHGLIDTPTAIWLTPSEANVSVAVTSASTTTITVAMKYMNITGMPPVTAAQTVYWGAEV